MQLINETHKAVISLSNIVNSGNVSLIQLINDTNTAVEALETDLEALKSQISETNATLGNKLSEVEFFLQNNINAANTVETEINATKVDLQTEIREVKTEINAAKVELQTEIDDLDGKIEDIIASLQTDTTDSTGTSTRRQNRRLQSDDTNNSTALGPAVGTSLGLTVDVRCPPMNGSGKSNKGSETLAIDLLINTQAFGKDCNATVSNATTIYINKDGDYKSQVGEIVSSIPMVKGVQIVRIHFAKEKDEINKNEDISILHITAIEESGTHQKSVMFDYNCEA